MPRFSVIVTTHERPALLARALASLRQQTRRCDQIIVVSDVADPSTYQAFDRASRETDIFVQRGGDPGPAQSRNIGIGLATGDFVLFLDDDDSFRPEFLESLAAVLPKQPANQISYTNFEVVNEGADRAAIATDIQAIDIGGYEPAWAYVKNFIPNNCQVFPRALLTETRFDPEIVYEDWDFLLSACRRASLKHLPILGPRIHKSTHSGVENRGKKNESRLLDCYLRVYRKHPPVTTQVEKQRKELFASLGLDIGALVNSRPLEAPAVANAQSTTCDQSGFAALVQKAWHGPLELGELVERAGQLEEGGLRPLAAVLYQTWLERNETPFNHLVYFNLGTVLSSAGDLTGAQRAYVRAIALAPDFAQSHFNLGSVYERLNQADGAIIEWTWVVDHVPPELAEQRAIRQLALNNLGRLHEQLRQYADALSCLTKSLEMDPNQADVLHHWVFLRAKQCEWPVYASVANVDPQLMRRSTSALAMIALSDDPQEQLAAAQHYVRDKVKVDVPALSQARAYGHKRLRVAYLSSDFCLHPVAFLTAELFELHDRERFEVYGYCWTRDDGSAVRKRIIAAMDRFVRIDSLTDEAAARRIRDDEIDVLIDLHGQTLGARPNVLAFRPAPIQITYLGLPATTGLPFIDYVIADRFLIPDEAVPYYSEKPLYMPDVYQVSDRRRPCAALPTRASCGLPEDAFVFCSFNNNFKYTPQVFAVWMNILRRVPGSVLWLLSDNPWAESNLRKEAARLGLDAGRIIFASRVAPEVYLARYGVADLFLDSFPFNAGTTANEALWMGLPVLTCSGRTFASRMAGALLTAAQLDELITYNLRDYEEKAVALASAPEQCQRIRETLRNVKKSGALFDTPRFVRHLERHFEMLVAGLTG